MGREDVETSAVCDFKAVQSLKGREIINPLVKMC